MLTQYGSFSGRPRTEWLDNGRDMSMLAPFAFIGRDGRVWQVEIGDIINGASIPRPLWSLFGSPFTGLYRNATVLHDKACQMAKTVKDQEEADSMFYWACLAGGCGKTQAWELYLGVRIGSFSPSYALQVYGQSLQDIPQTSAFDCVFTLDAEIVRYAAEPQPA